MVRDRGRSVRCDAADQVRPECTGAIYKIRRLDRRVHCCHSALGDGGRRRRNPRRDVSHAEDERVAPDGAVTRCRAGGEQGQDELNFLAGEGVQVFVELIDHPLVLFPPRPQDVDRAVIDLIVESEGDVAGRSVGAAHGRMEMVTGPDGVFGEEALDIAVVLILGRDDQAGDAVGDAILEHGVVNAEGKAAPATVRRWAGQLPGAAHPPGRAQLLDKVEARSGGRRERCEVEHFVFDAVVMPPVIIGRVEGISCQLGPHGDGLIAGDVHEIGLVAAVRTRGGDQHTAVTGIAAIDVDACQSRPVKAHGALEVQSRCGGRHGRRGRNRLGDVDIHPEGARCIASQPKLNSLRIVHLPIAAVMTGRGGSVHIQRQVHLLARLDNGRGRGGGCAERVAADEGQAIGMRPGAGTRVLEPPDLCEGHARLEVAAIRDGDVGDEAR